MVIVYHGNVPAVKEGLAAVVDRLDERYRMVLGEGRAALVTEAAKRLLTPESFYDDPEEYNRLSGSKLLSLTSCNKLMLCTDSILEFTPRGELQTKKLKTAAGFYISEQGFAHSGSAKFTDNPIASYVHEYNHFIAYLLQQRPLFLLYLIADRLSQTKNWFS